jgi:hypothetical protein
MKNIVVMPLIFQLISLLLNSMVLQNLLNPYLCKDGVIFYGLKEGQLTQSALFP